MTDAMIRVPDYVRDRLAVLAEARGTSIRVLVQELAESTLTPEERAARAEKARAYIAANFGVDLTAEDEADMKRKVQDAFAGPGKAAA